MSPISCLWYSKQVCLIKSDFKGIAYYTRHNLLPITLTIIHDILEAVCRYFQGQWKKKNGQDKEKIFKQNFKFYDNVVRCNQVCRTSPKSEADAF